MPRLTKGFESAMLGPMLVAWANREGLDRMSDIACRKTYPRKSGGARALRPDTAPGGITLSNLKENT